MFGEEPEIIKLFESHPSLPAQRWSGSTAPPNNLRGEFVLLVSGAPLETGAIDSETERILKLVLKDLPLKQAVQLAAQIASSRRNELY